jgi:hypothetical protein
VESFERAIAAVVAASGLRKRMAPYASVQSRVNSALIRFSTLTFMPETGPDHSPESIR